MLFYKALFLISQIMRKIIKDNLYIESYKILCAVEQYDLYNELIFNIFIQWEQIKYENNISQFTIPKIDINKPFHQIITLFEVLDRQIETPLIKRIKINMKYKTIQEWNKYMRYICGYFNIDRDILCKITMRIDNKISFYEYKEISKLFLKK